MTYEIKLNHQFIILIKLVIFIVYQQLPVEVLVVSNEMAVAIVFISGNTRLTEKIVHAVRVNDDYFCLQKTQGLLQTSKQCPVFIHKQFESNLFKVFVNGCFSTKIFVISPWC